MAGTMTAHLVMTIWGERQEHVHIIVNMWRMSGTWRKDEEYIYIIFISIKVTYIQLHRIFKYQSKETKLFPAYLSLYISY